MTLDPRIGRHARSGSPLSSRHARKGHWAACSCGTFEMTSRRVLVAEDGKSMAGVVVSLLRRNGYEVDVAADGEEALRLLAHRRDYAALVVDLMMPNIDGAGVIAELEAIAPQLLQRTILITGHPDSEMATRVASRCRRLLPKPFGLRVLLDAVRECATAE